MGLHCGAMIKSRFAPVWLLLTSAVALGCGGGGSGRPSGTAGSSGASGAPGGPGGSSSGGAVGTGGESGAPAGLGGSEGGGAAGAAGASGTPGGLGGSSGGGAAGTAGASGASAAGAGGLGVGGAAGAAGAAGTAGASAAGAGGAGLWDAVACGWELVGGQVSSATAESEDPAMLLLDGAPTIGYRQASFEVRLHTWGADSWSSTAPDPTDGQLTGLFYRAPDFCFDGSRVVMAYAHAGDSTADDETFYDRVFAYEYTVVDGWSALDGGDEVSQHWDSSEQVGYDADDPSVACAPGQAPAVAWIETDLTAEQDDDVFVAREVGGSFVSSDRINRVSAAGTYALVVDVELDSADRAYVAHFELAQDASFTSNLYVTRYDGTLLPLGGVVDTDQDTNQLSAPSLAVASENEVYVAYSADRDGDGQRDIYVQRWNGSEWSDLAGGPVSAFGADHYDSGQPDLILVDGTPVIAWDESNEYEGHFIYVARHTGTEWEILCDALNVDANRDARDPSLVFDPTTATLYAGFEENVDGYPEIFVRQLALGS